MVQDCMETHVMEEILGESCKNSFWQCISPENNTVHFGKTQVLGLKSSRSA